MCLLSPVQPQERLSVTPTVFWGDLPTGLGFGVIKFRVLSLGL